MSQYISFFIKSNKDEYLPIGSFSRNTYMYDSLQCEAPYNNIKPLKESHIFSSIKYLKSLMKENEEDIKEKEERKEQILRCNNSSIAEKLTALDLCDKCISEITEDLESIKYTISTLNTYGDILSESCSCNYDKDNYIYFGIEVGNPNKKTE